MPKWFGHEPAAALDGCLAPGRQRVARWWPAPHPPQAEGNFVLDESLVVHHCGSGLSAIPGLLAMEVAALGCTWLYAGSWGEWYKTTDLAVEMGEPIHTGAGLRLNFCSWRSRFPKSCRYFVYQGRPRRNMPIQGLAGGLKNQTRNAS
ncbi:hypothetical protein [Hydrogenophaga sp.]|uniref:hypothetical protein n=1 Tax=Hydrogenophaga sp. TaxID=1904254 RepID=UPI003522C847